MARVVLALRAVAVSWVIVDGTSCFRALDNWMRCRGFPRKQRGWQNGVSCAVILVREAWTGLRGALRRFLPMAVVTAALALCHGRGHPTVFFLLKCVALGVLAFRADAHGVAATCWLGAPVASVPDLALRSPASAPAARSPAGDEPARSLGVTRTCCTPSSPATRQRKSVRPRVAAPA